VESSYIESPGRCGEQLHIITRSLWRAVTYNHQVVVESSYI